MFRYIHFGMSPDPCSNQQKARSPEHQIPHCLIQWQVLTHFFPLCFVLLMFLLLNAVSVVPLVVRRCVEDTTITRGGNEEEGKREEHFIPKGCSVFLMIKVSVSHPVVRIPWFASRVPSPAFYASALSAIFLVCVYFFLLWWTFCCWLFHFSCCFVFFFL